MTVVAIIFWLSLGLLLYTHVGYFALLAGLARVLPRRPPEARPADARPPDPGGLTRACRTRVCRDQRRPAAGTPSPGQPPAVSVIVAAYAEQDVIASRVANLRALHYPRERLEIIVACDGSPDETAPRARAAGADLVLELPRGGKIRAQDAGVARARGEIVAFSDANTSWEPAALRALIAPFADPRVGYVCGEVRLLSERGTNQEGLYWRYEMAMRALESRVRSITAGNGAIYATRHDAYLVVDPVMGHDLSFPFNMVKRGWLAVFARDARASEKMVPSIEGEFARKRRMMSHTWPIVVRGGMLSPRGYGALYALMMFSHRVLRYGSGFLHVFLLAANLALLGHGWVYVVVARRAAGRAGRRAGGRSLAAPAPAHRPLLRADHLLAAGRAVGLAGPGDPGRLGAGGGDPVRALKRGLDLLIAGLGVDRVRPGGGAVGGRRAPRVRGASDLHPDPDRARWRALHDLQAAHDGVRSRVHRRGPGHQSGR